MPAHSTSPSSRIFGTATPHTEGNSTESGQEVQEEGKEGAHPAKRDTHRRQSIRHDNPHRAPSSRMEQTLVSAQKTGPAAHTARDHTHNA